MVCKWKRVTIAGKPADCQYLMMTWVSWLTWTGSSCCPEQVTVLVFVAAKFLPIGSHHINGDHLLARPPQFYIQSVIVAAPASKREISTLQFHPIPPCKRNPPTAPSHSCSSKHGSSPSAPKYPPVSTPSSPPTPAPIPPQLQEPLPIPD